MIDQPKGPDTPHRELVNKSGFPFQLAVERDIRSIGGEPRVEIQAAELPWAGGFVDLVLKREKILIVIECKRVDSGVWVFLVPKGKGMNEAGCRLEWYNGRAPDRQQFAQQRPTKMFCSEFTMCEGSPESNVCVVPKSQGTVQTLEGVCGPLLDACHEIGDLPGVQHDGEIEFVVPAVVTNAALKVCEYDPASMTLPTGHIGPAQFHVADFVRFRKALVRRRNDDYRSQPVKLGTWAGDRERTVFIVNHSGLRRFLHGFRAFSYAGPGQFPPEYENPDWIAER